MIIDFKIKNFRSYRDETVFTFEALEEDFNSDNYTVTELENGETIRLLKSAAIFGANASGKSNVIWAFHALSFLVANSRNFDVRTAIPTYIPFVLDEQTRMAPTELTIDFIVNRKRFRYTIHFNSIILFEGLYIINNGEKELVFELDGETKPNSRGLQIGDKWQSGTVDFANAQFLANHLILSEIGTRQVNGLLDIYTALANIQAEPVGDSINLKANNENVAANILKNNQSLFGRLKRLIHIADMGINDVVMIEHHEDEFKFPDSVSEDAKKIMINNNKWEFGMVHQSQKEHITIGMSLESTGTKNLFGLGARILDILENGGFLAYDEMNIAIHPELFQLLVSFFNNPKSNPHHAQLLFTTHDASIAGNSTLRADQIWFAEKDNNGVSQLFSAQDFEDIGINSPFERWYRAGRFGALPKFGNINYIFDDERKKENA